MRRTAKTFLRRDVQLTVGPNPEAVKVLGGRRFKNLSQAIECWAHVIEYVSSTLDFTPEVWKTLALRLRRKVFDPSFSSPQDIIAECCQSIEGMDRDLEEMSYEESWAIIVAVEWYWRRSHRLPKGFPWWDVGQRKDWK